MDRFSRKYLDYLKNVKKRSESTLKQYKSVLKEFSKYKYRREDFRRYLKDISKNSPKTQQMKLSVVKGYLSWLYSQGYIKKRFWEDAEPPRSRALPHYFSPEELSRFFSAIDDPYYKALFRFLVNTGLRISEFMALSEEDLQTFGQTVRIRVRGKGSKERIIQVDPEIMEEVINQGILKKKPSARTIQRKMKEYLNKAGIRKKLTPHSLRHTFAILLMEHGVPLNRIQLLLGHESIATTSIYLKIVGEGEKIPKVF